MQQVLAKLTSEQDQIVIIIIRAPKHVIINYLRAELILN